MLKSYFKKDFFRKEYYVTLWALICPFVAYAVFGAFVYNLFLQTPILKGVILASLITGIIFYIIISIRFFKYGKEEASISVAPVKQAA